MKDGIVYSSGKRWIWMKRKEDEERAASERNVLNKWKRVDQDLWNWKERGKTHFFYLFPLFFNLLTMHQRNQVPLTLPR
jgi:hypothetical protein